MRIGPLPGPGRRRLAEQPAPAARGVGHDRHEGRDERRRQPERPRRLVGRGLDAATTAGRSAAASRSPTRPPRTGPTRWTCTGSSRTRSCPSTTTATRRACPARWVERMRRSMATTLWQFSTTRMLHEYTERLYLPAAGIEAGRAAERPRTEAATVRARDDPARISLALTLHNHQPIGNFGWVFAEVFEQAYEPMVEALERHPTVRVGLHYTGPLLEWLRAERPGVHRRPARRSSSAARSRSSAAACTSRSSRRCRSATAIGQLDAHGRRGRGDVRAAAARRVARRARLGAGPADVARGRGLRAGRSSTTPTSAPPAIPEDAMWGPYTTDDQGRLLTVFGTEQGLRYRIPFHDVDEVIELPPRARHGGGRARRDDGRRRREVRRLADDVGALLGQGPLGRAVLRGARGERRLADDRPPERLAGRATRRSAGSTSRPARTPRWASGRCRPTRARAFADGAASRARRRARPRRAGCAARSGATSRSSTARSTTSTSRCSGSRTKVEAMAPGAARDAALDHLYRGQSNDCYWHGLFGGIYIAHMRAATLAAPDRRRGPRRRGARARRRAPSCATSTSTGATRSRSRTTGQVVTIDLDEGAGIGSWDLRAARHALTGVLRRRPEAYHETLRGTSASRGGRRRSRRGDGATADGAAPRRSTSASRSRSRPRRPPGLRRLRAPQRPRPDPARRTRRPQSGRAGGARRPRRFRGRPVPRRRASTPARPSSLGTARRRSTARASRSRLETRDPARRRPAGPDARAVDVTIENRGDAPLAARIGIEWAITMLGGGGNPEAWWEVGGRADAPRRRRRGARASIGSPRATTGSASSSRRPSRRPPTPGARRSRRSRTPRPASSASTRAARCCSRGRSGSRRASAGQPTIRHARGRRRSTPRVAEPRLLATRA